MSAHETFSFHGLDEVRQRIGELGLDLELSDDLSPLAEPLRAGDFTIPNRMVVLPMEGCDGTAGGAPDELTFRRYHRFAAGGAGLLWVEATAVVEEGRANPRQIWLRKENVGEFARLVEETLAAARRSMGDHHRPMLIAQLTHSGRYSRPGRAPRPIIAHHSRFIDPVQKLPADYPLITDDELERLEDRYVEAAVCAQWAGFDGVDVKACHRYLISELHASYTREGSRYGGSWENRSRFFRNIVKKIRQAAPGLMVTSRMNAHDAMAYPYGFGMDPEDADQAGSRRARRSGALPGPERRAAGEHHHRQSVLQSASEPPVRSAGGRRAHAQRASAGGHRALRSHRARHTASGTGHRGDRRRLFVDAAVLAEPGGGERA